MRQITINTVDPSNKAGMKLRAKYLLLLSGLVFACLLILSLSLVIDLHLYDTYLVLQGYLLPAFSLLFLVFVWMLYAACAERMKSKRVAFIHLGLTIFFLLFIAILPVVYQVLNRNSAGAPRHYYSGFSFERYSNPIYLSELLVVALVLLILVQVLFLLNLRRKKVP